MDYAYDGAYRLIEEKITEPVAGVKTISYTYDTVGNRLTRTEDGVTITYTYAVRDRLLTADGLTFTYDNNGNLLTRTDVGFYYLRARYYNPVTGRLTTTDPFEGTVFDPPSLHKYLYTMNDPVNRMDPSSPP